MKSILFLLGFAAITAQAQPAFRAGVSAIDITPTSFPRIIAGGFLEGRGDKIADRLHVRSFVLDDGKMKIAFAIVDTCMMEQSLIDEAKALASKQCGIPVDRMMVSATHTHSAPAAMGCLGTPKDTEYGNFLTPKIAEAIVAADKALQPARIGWGSFDDWEHTHNRRWIRLPGKEVVDPFGEPTGRANMHPGYLSKDVVGPSGPVDPQLSVISMQTIDGKPLGVLANYSQHYFGSGPISSDYYGLFCKHLAAKLSQQGEGNGPFVCAMSQGTSGDLMWMDYGAEKKNITLDEYASAVAESAMQALKTVKYHDHVPLRMVEKTLELNYRVPDEKRLAWARPIAAKIKNDVPKNKEEVYAREALILHERQNTSVKLQAIRIGDLSIATLPNEVYAITGLKLKKFSPAKSHFNIELANGAEGYIPPPEQHKLGGYTTWPARTAGLEVLAEPKSVQTLLGALEEVTGQKRRSEQSENGPYAKDIIASKPVAYWRLDEISTDYSLRSEVPILKRPGGRDLHFAVSTSRCAMYLPGVGSGSGCGDQEKLRSSLFSGPEAINRCVHVAGGEIDGYVPALGDHHSVALWFWAGRLVDIGDKPEIELFRTGIEWVRLSSKRGNGWHLTTPGPSGADGTPIRSRMISGGDPTAIKHGSTVISENSWHFLVYSKKGNEKTVFLDGKKEMSTELEPAFKESRKVDVSMLAFGQSFEGKLDEIAVWDRVIEPEFIEQLWETSKMEEANERDAAARLEKAKQARAQTSAMLKGHENWSASLRFRNTKANDASPVTAYLISRGPKGDHQAPGDHLGIGGSYKDSLPGRLFVYNGNAANQIVRGQTLITPASWNEVKLERQGSHVKVMLNGKVEIDAELPVTAPGATELFFGRRCDDFAPLEGEFADVAVTGLEKPAAAAPKPQVELASQPLGPEESAKKWHVREGYRIDLVAAEPVVLDPVAFDWDDKGRLWVIEMADYPLGMDGNGKAGGRVVMLEDTNSDGSYDKRTVIVNDLSYPTGILTWRDGVIVTAAPDIFFIKPSGEKQILYTGFSTGNQQLRVNGLRWGMDGWVYCAAGAHHGGYNKGTQIECRLTGQKIDLGSRDFRFKPDTGEFDPQSGPSQFGRAHDDWGHWFGVQNSFPLWHYVLQDHYLRRNPYVIPPDPVHQLFPRNPPVYPASSMEKRFHSFDQAGRFTSACGIEVYRDRVLFGDGKTHAFTCEPFHNVVQHHVLEDDGVTFRATRDPAESKMDFLASEDRWCRPVMVRTGPDGALWVADMYRYMIEHPQWLPQNGKDELLPHYREGDDKGRIWKVSRANATAKAAAATPSLTSTNGWLRDKAQMQSLWSNKPANFESKPADAAASAQSGWLALQKGSLTSAACLTLLQHESPHVREQALQMAEKLHWGKDSPSLGKSLAELLDDKDEKVRLQLACTLGELQGDWAADLLATLLHTAPSSSPLQGAAMSSVMPHLERICVRFTDDEKNNPQVIGMLFRCALAVKNEKALAFLLSEQKAQKHAVEFLAVLDEAGLSLASFAQQTTSEAARQGLKQMTGMLTKAAETVKNAPAAPPMADLELLASDREHRELVKELLPELWQKSADSGVLRLAAKLQPKNGPEFLLAGWNERIPTIRLQIIETLLSSDDWTLALLKRPEAKGCDAATRARLTKHPKKEIAKLAATVFKDASSSTRAAVVEKFKPALKLKGDAAKGKTTFAQVCISCHKLDGVGIELGPDLRSVVQHDAEKLLNSILDPSAIIEPGFMAYHCTLKNGEQLYGVIATETSASLTLKMAGNMTKSVLRSDISKLQSTGASLMPEGLEAALTPQTLADLIAYLQMPK